ncbi:MAG TPA: fumarylacetoacetate hydrolase family protein [Acidimicrobiales bacterium]|nr:fumarylacetoacetate hydrolase family protein [Acidimicrobiales bacterium]
MFRLICTTGRAALEIEGRAYDLAELGGDPGLVDPMVAIARSAELHDWSASTAGANPIGDTADLELDAPVPRPRQVFAIGLNYADHAAESGMEAPPAPLTFTKFPSSIAAPHADIPLSGVMVDWEVEIVAVIGKRVSHVAVEEAWSVVAGLTLGQDISDRMVQLTGVPPQFSLGKSFSGYSPIGPAVVSIDALADPDDLELTCDVSGERMQSGRSSEMLFTIPQLVAYLSSVCVLEPGDLIFTGTPAGVGMSRNRYLVDGDVIISEIPGIGRLENRCVPGRPAVTL